MEIPAIPLFWIMPFVLLLLSIAIIPLVSTHFWGKYYPIFSVILGLIVVVLYLTLLNTQDTHFYGSYKLFHTFIEYVGFIALVGSLFVVVSGIYLDIIAKPTPFINASILSIGCILANVMGTVGASMLLIRPYLRINNQRIKPYHLVFFIFLVSNMGGALLPIGDPPLFLGYLKGIPFFWLIDRIFFVWLLGLGIVLIIFIAFEFFTNKKASNNVENMNEYGPKEIKIEVLGKRNFIWLLCIILLVLSQNQLTSLGISSEMVTFFTSVLMITCSIFAYRGANKKALRQNEFIFNPIKEVAILFGGIFATMMPALDYLELNAHKLGLEHPGQFFFASGILSAFLDNAPTYLNFLSAAFGLCGMNVDNDLHMEKFLNTPELALYIEAISMGCVFFGALSYIGNAPNFMVKSIADQLEVKTPTFLGYMLKYSIPILIPPFFIVWLIFFS